VNNLEEIMKNPYIDGYIFGPNDLSGSINELGQVFAPNTTALIHKSIAMMKKAGKYIGLSTGDITDKTLTHWHDMGVDMLSAGADFDFLRDGMKNCQQALKKAHLGL